MSSQQTHRSLTGRVQRALSAMRDGRPVVVVDDLDREDEADLVIAAERITVESMALMIRECSGIVCLCLTGETLQRLQLPPMVERNESRHGTAFTVSIEAKVGVTTGVSAADRVTTVRAAIADHARAEDLARPGHIFPLMARPNGVLERRGHTEGAVDLARMAGLKPAAVLCELMNEDGTMARGAQIVRFAAIHRLPVISIADIAAYRCAQELAVSATAV
ncbi:3,4-dihydroxy-2-butanone-4-phosphate synthase [Paraburkholderia xenovorans LB400]|nr:3,4-dihydroxy-2-butanone-4-phosphate synthase [Paraburkholderia xenovorans LB400]